MPGIGRRPDEEGELAEAMLTVGVDQQTRRWLLTLKDFGRASNEVTRADWRFGADKADKGVAWHQGSTITLGPT